MKYHRWLLFSFTFLFLPFHSLLGQVSLTEISGYLYSDGRPVSVRIKMGEIREVVYLEPGSKVPDLYIAPGLIDIQVNGFMGIDFSANPITREDIQKAAAALWEEGVTTFLPTVVPNEPDRMLKSFRMLAGMLNDKKLRQSIPGFHLESPFISPVQGYRGAHLAKNIRLPDWREFATLQEASGGRIMLITLAPEVEGAAALIEKCRESEVVVSLGHHNGSAADIKRASDAGARMSTHLGNGCANMIDRHLNPLWPQLADERLTATLFVEGSISPDEVRCFYKIKGPDRTILISDAVDLAGIATWRI